MPRNLTPNHFDRAGIYVEGERSSFRFNKPVLSSFMSGMLVPLGDPIPVFPGTKLDLNINAVIRSNTMVVPPLDGMYVDFFAVWVPHRIVWNHMPQFLGEPETTAWTQSNTYIYPYVSLADLTTNTGRATLIGRLKVHSTDFSVSAGNLSLLDKYGLLNDDLRQSIVDQSVLPSGSLKINILAFRGYYSIWNYLFRDENYQRPVLFSKGDTGTVGEFGYLLRDYKIGSGSGDTVVSKLGVSLGVGCNYDQAVLMPVNKLHDAYTSVLPQAQFGGSVTLPLGSTAPVIIDGYKTTDVDFEDATISITGDGRNYSYGQGLKVMSQLTQDEPSLGVDLTSATAATINQFRTSVMYQRYLEALARGGRRMPEFYSTIYGVNNTSAKCDYPELISRARYQLGVNQVVATADGSGSGWTSHLGDTGAYSLTVLRGIPCCEKDFTEFGYLHILYCVRADNRYSQMIQPHFVRSELLDEYNPFFDHIGDVSVDNCLVNSSTTQAGSFGYQEAWFDERTQMSMATGALNKAYGSLKHWVLGEVFDGTLQACNPSYLTFDPGIFDDVFVSNYYTYPQFIIDGLIYGKKIARMSQHSIPGIVGRI